MEWVIQSLTRVVRKIGPRRLGPLMPLLRGMSRTYRRLDCFYAGLWDRRFIRKTGIVRLPPARLRYRVHGSPNIASFLEGGRQTHERILAALDRMGTPITNFDRALDWGCGCGRTLRWFESGVSTPQFFGADIDREAIAWCRENLPFAVFDVNGALPPLPYAAGQFDLVYGVSVLTHLDEGYQFRWLEELRRVTHPGAMLLLSVHTSATWSELSADEQSRLQDAGFFYQYAQCWKGIFPDWYQNAFHSHSYIRQRFSDYFDVVDIVRLGASDRQDLVVLRHRG